MNYKLLIFLTLSAITSQSFAMQNNDQLTQAQRRALTILNHIMPTAQSETMQTNPTSSSKFFDGNLVRFTKNIVDESKKKIGHFIVCKDEKKDIFEHYIGYLEIHGKIVSKCNWFRQSPEAIEIEDLVVSKNLRSNGYGTQLGMHVAQYCADNGIKRMRWIAHAFNLRKNETREMMQPKLIEFYKRLGADFYHGNFAQIELE